MISANADLRGSAQSAKPKERPLSQPQPFLEEVVRLSSCVVSGTDVASLSAGGKGWLDVVTT